MGHQALGTRSSFQSIALTIFCKMCLLEDCESNKPNQRRLGNMHPCSLLNVEPILAICNVCFMYVL